MDVVQLDLLVFRKHFKSLSGKAKYYYIESLRGADTKAMSSL